MKYVEEGGNDSTNNENDSSADNNDDMQTRHPFVGYVNLTKTMIGAVLSLPMAFHTVSVSQ